MPCNKLHCCTFTTTHWHVQNQQHILHQLLSPILAFLGCKSVYTSPSVRPCWRRRIYRRGGHFWYKSWRGPLFPFISCYKAMQLYVGPAKHCRNAGPQNLSGPGRLIGVNILKSSPEPYHLRCPDDPQSSGFLSSSIHRVTVTFIPFSL